MPGTAGAVVTSHGIEICPALQGDTDSWLRLRRALWPEGSESELGREVESYLHGRAREPQAVFLAVAASGTAVSFVELSIRAFAEGCRSDRVAYLGGWHAAPQAHGRRIGRKLLAAAEAWARAQGCTELASDTPADNDPSRQAHEALGFENVGTIRCFHKSL